MGNPPLPLVQLRSLGKKEGNVLRSKEPARGIFANIDFEALNKRPAKRPRSPSNSPPPKVKEENEGKKLSLVETSRKTRSESSSSEDNFGPALPPSMKVESITIISTNSDEGKEHKKSKKKKEKKKKHKH